METASSALRVPQLPAILLTSGHAVPLTTETSTTELVLLSSKDHCRRWSGKAGRVRGTENLQ